MTTRIQLRGGTASQWTAANPILANREPGVETNTGLMKIGDGVDAVDGGVQMLGDLGRGVAGLQVQKARHDRQVVFDPMVEFVQQRGLMGLRTFERCDVYVEVREASG